jgi:cell filamentation protein
LKNGRRYNTSGIAEAEFEPGSGRRVLKNLLGIKRKREMDRIKARELLRAHEETVTLYDRDHQFSAGDICKMHQIWLGPIYPWAGQYRKVNLTRDNSTFAAANQIPKLMNDLEKGPLASCTPCTIESIDLRRAGHCHQAEGGFKELPDEYPPPRKRARRKHET